MDEFRKYKPMVYVCSPYSGDTQYNTAQAKKYSRFAYEQGAIPMTPHLLYPQFMCDENPAERSDAMHFNYVLLGNCSELWVFGSRVSDRQYLPCVEVDRDDRRLPQNDALVLDVDQDGGGPKVYSNIRSKHSVFLL